MESEELKESRQFSKPRDVDIDGYQLKLTCQSHPEQYHIFKSGEQVGYLRLRHGDFYAEVPECGGVRIYESSAMYGDGEFHRDEREFYLRQAVAAIDKHLRGDDAS